MAHNLGLKESYQNEIDEIKNLIGLVEIHSYNCSIKQADMNGIKIDLKNILLKSTSEHATLKLGLEKNNSNEGHVMVIQCLPNFYRLIDNGCIFEFTTRDELALFIQGRLQTYYKEFDDYRFRLAFPN